MAVVVVVHMDNTGMADKDAVVVVAGLGLGLAEPVEPSSFGTDSMLEPDAAVASASAAVDWRVC